MPRVRLRPSTLRDITSGAAFGTRRTPGPGQVDSVDLKNGVILGPHFAHVRNVLQIPFDDSIDATHPLECFFQMPTDTLLIKSAKVWVQRKSFRAYETGSSSGGGQTSSSGGSHSHGLTYSNSGTTLHTIPHTHPESGGGTTGSGGNEHGHVYSVGSGTTSGGGDHDHSVSNHVHGITYGIFEQAAAGTLSVYVADDGAAYGSALTSGATSVTGLALTGLSITAGDKRIKIEGTGLMRVQVLVMLDLIIKVPPLT